MNKINLCCIFCIIISSIVISGCASTKIEKYNVVPSQQDDNLLRTGVIKSPTYKLNQLVGMSPLISDAFFPPHKSKALFRERLKAVLHNSKAQAQMGDLYFDGIIAERDLDLAFHWYRQAAEQGSAYAMLMLGVINEFGYGREPDQRKASRWYQRADNSPQRPSAQAQLADRYLYKASPLYNPREAVKWYLRAALADNLHAQIALADLYFEGQQVEQSYVVALRWYVRAARQNSGYAQYKLGLLFQEGWGVKQDYDNAVTMLRAAATQGIGPAQYHLAALYENGHGVKPDQTRSYAWLSMAAKNARAAGDLNDHLKMKLETMIKQMRPELRDQAVDLEYEYTPTFTNN